MATAPGPWNDLFDLCAEWLACCEAALTLTGNPPARSMVSPPGIPPPDYCEQLTVCGGYMVADTLPLLPPLGPGHRANVQGGVLLVPLVATVYRCVPMPSDNGQPPSTAAIEESSMALHADLWAILNHTWDQKRKGLLFPPKEREMFVDPAVPISSMSGFGGWQMQIRVALPGFESAS